MTKFYIIALLSLLYIPLSAQVRIKPGFEIGSGGATENLYVYNWGVTIEKKLDINKSIETGLFYHNFELQFPKDQYGFYEAFIAGTPNEAYRDSITNIKVSFNFTTIPVGFNYYLSPKVYFTYKVGFNFFNSGTYKGQYAPQDSLSETKFKEYFEVNKFKKFYVNHALSINRIFLRRFDLGVGMIFTPQKNFIIDQSNEVFKTFDKEISRYVAGSVHFKIFLFQVKATKI